MAEMIFADVLDEVALEFHDGWDVKDRYLSPDCRLICPCGHIVELGQDCENGCENPVPL